MAANSNPLLPPLPILMRIDNGLPEPKSLRFGTRMGKISLLCTHRLVKDGALIPMQLPSDAFAQPNELVVVNCLVGCHRKIRYSLKQFQLVAALDILVDLLAAVMNGIAVVVDHRGQHLWQQPGLYFIPATSTLAVSVMSGVRSNTRSLRSRPSLSPSRMKAFLLSSALPNAYPP